MADPSIFAASAVAATAAAAAATTEASCPELRRGLRSARGTASAAASPAEAIAHDDSDDGGNNCNKDKVMVQRQPQTTIKQQLGTDRR